MNRKALKSKAKALIRDNMATVFLTLAAEAVVMLALSIMTSMLLAIGGAAFIFNPFIGVIVYLIVTLVSVVILTLGSIIVTLGVTTVYRKLADGEETSVQDIMAPMREGWVKLGVISYLLVCLKGFLIPMIPLIVVGILSAIIKPLVFLIPIVAVVFYVLVIMSILKYTYVPYLLTQNVDATAGEVLNYSVEMTNGHKKDLFLLGLSFFGWIFLGPFLCGIPLIYAIPYMLLTFSVEFTRQRDIYENGESAVDDEEDYEPKPKKKKPAKQQRQPQRNAQDTQRRQQAQPAQQRRRPAPQQDDFEDDGFDDFEEELQPRRRQQHPVQQRPAQQRATQQTQRRRPAPQQDDFDEFDEFEEQPRRRQQAPAQRQAQRPAQQRQPQRRQTEPQSDGFDDFGDFDDPYDNDEGF